MSRCLLFVMLAVWGTRVASRVCPGRLINKPEGLPMLENCTHVYGDLIVADPYRDMGPEIRSIAFPDLVEISGFLGFFNMHWLTSIGGMFPNLRAIRGLTTMKGYSLIAFEMYDLQQLGLTNLLLIERGSVSIDSCPKLCTDTVDWKEFGVNNVRMVSSGYEVDCQNPCPQKCNGYCWNSTHCVDRDKFLARCPDECLGCTSKDECLLCKDPSKVLIGGKCLDSCPKNEYRLMDTCVSREICETFDVVKNVTYVAHLTEKGERYCLDKCPKYHEYKEIVTADNKIVRSCSYCGHACVIVCDVNEDIVSEADIMRLSGCTHLVGPLHIQNVKLPDLQHLLLEHLSDVRSISGGLRVTRTKLASLEFLRNVTFIGSKDPEVPRADYSIVVFENPDLQDLWAFRSTLKLEGKYSFHDNPILCLSKIDHLRNVTKVDYNVVDVSVNSNGDQAACFTKNIEKEIHLSARSTNATVIWQLPASEVPTRDVFLSTTIYYKKTDSRNETFYIGAPCEIDKKWNEEYNVTDSSNVTFSLNNLTPFSFYAYYLRRCVETDLDSKCYLSTIMYFNTTADDPDGFVKFNLEPIDHSSIKLEWEKPTLPNGVLAEYRLFYFNLEEDFLFERDYCKHPRTKDGDMVDIDEKDHYPSPLDDHEDEEEPKPPDDCDCKEKTKVEFIPRGAKSQLCVDIALSLTEQQTCDQYEYQSEKRKKRSDAREKLIDPNVTSVLIDDLKPFKMYVFFLRACNEPKTEHFCSGVLQRFVRTRAKPGADDVVNFKSRYDEDVLNVSWTPPSSPNTPIVAYRVTINSENNIVPVTTCIAMFNDTNGTIHRAFRDVTPGWHSIVVQAETLAGVSRGVAEKFFVPYPSNGHGSLITVCVLIVLFLASAGAGYYYFRKKRMDKLRLIIGVNPYYPECPEYPIYPQDHWEMDPDDIELVTVLGKGNFGTVYQGLIKSKDHVCAVKVVNEALNEYQRMEILVEASVMKAFSDCYHVVRLLGVVSTRQPPFVVMELMERGDLRNYLRKMRDSSQDLTSNEIYRMAVEIADGMAYLSARKFVHRDLAARNCMVAADRTVKVGDFGMTRDIYTTDYYRKASKGLLPVRWMAPESLADGVFTTDSDVWSFGIVLWEIATLAEQPYQGLSNENVRQFIISKGRLTRPPECSDLLYDIMKQCWSWRPGDRPSFWDIVERLEDKVSEDFKLVSFVHSLEASQYSRQRVDIPAALGIAPREELLCHYNVSDEDVSLHVGGVPRRPGYLQASISHRRFSPPDDIY
ncbi:unnamed protein product [Phyllotreta striolata]|uniref:Tyrosine-protein kinase receptor n=1 Tax=Phyllotreta striolata TaxID=444603 RepID=A0A9N9THT0_PHYSR|nr:unnamed protein product [Phyllotreta striolata]